MKLIHLTKATTAGQIVNLSIDVNFITAVGEELNEKTGVIIGSIVFVTNSEQPFSVDEKHDYIVNLLTAVGIND